MAPADRLCVSGQNLLNGQAQITTSCPDVMITSITSATSSQIAFAYTVYPNAPAAPCLLTVSAGAAGQAQVGLDVVPFVSIWDGSAGFGTPPSPGVAVGGSMSYFVNLTPGASPSEPVVLSLGASGSGTAQFNDGTTSTTITGSAVITIQGIGGSTSVDDIALIAKAQRSPVRILAQIRLSAVNVVLSINNATTCNAPFQPPCVSSDDDGAANYQTINQTQNTGPHVITGTATLNGVPNSPAGVCSIGVEFLGMVTPANYRGTVSLRRTQGQSGGHGGYVYLAEYLGLPQMLVATQTQFTMTIGKDDTSIPVSQAGTGGAFPRPSPYNPNKVYDLDAPGSDVFEAWQNPLTTSFTRYNFTEFAVLDPWNAPITATHPVGNSISWFSRSSCEPDSLGNYPRTYQNPITSEYYYYSFSTFYANDNQSDTGTTATSVSLQ